MRPELIGYVCTYECLAKGFHFHISPHAYICRGVRERLLSRISSCFLKTILFNSFASRNISFGKNFVTNN